MAHLISKCSQSDAVSANPSTTSVWLKTQHEELRQTNTQSDTPSIDYTDDPSVVQINNEEIIAAIAELRAFCSFLRQPHANWNNKAPAAYLPPEQLKHLTTLYQKYLHNWVDNDPH